MATATQEQVITFISLVPHVINVHNEKGDIARVFHPSGQVARLRLTREEAGIIDGISLRRVIINREPVGIPDPVNGTRYIVSGLVREALPDRIDLLSPGELLRDGAGQVIGCLGLVTN